ncbi:MAG: glycosyltransferase [Anaerolineae bacterium]|nr:glycosyltransferase [Anaerolineae bacterium]
MRVHQMTATLAYGDGVTDYILEIDRYLRGWGLDSRMYAEHIGEPLSSVGHYSREYQPFLNETEDLLIYHHSIYTSNMQLYRQSHNRKVVVYHNITPHKFFHGYDSGLEAVCRYGRLLLSEFRSCELVLADSEFNRQELIAAGIPENRTRILPISLGVGRFVAAERNATLYAQIKETYPVNLLSVGRVVPNKACEDLIKILYMYRKTMNSDAHLWLVGYRVWKRYSNFLEALVRRLGLEDAVTFTGSVSVADLRTYYEASDVFLCASRHEGFGIPLVESMHFDLPVLAYKATAVPETLGDSGVLYTRLGYAEVTEMLHLLVTDDELRRRVIARQRSRLRDFAPDRVAIALHKILEALGIF